MNRIRLNFNFFIDYILEKHNNIQFVIVKCKHIGMNLFLYGFFDANNDFLMDNKQLNITFFEKRKIIISVSGKNSFPLIKKILGNMDTRINTFLYSGEDNIKVPEYLNTYNDTNYDIYRGAFTNFILSNDKYNKDIIDMSYTDKEESISNEPNEINFYNVKDVINRFAKYDISDKDMDYLLSIINRQNNIIRDASNIKIKSIGVKENL